MAAPTYPLPLATFRLTIDGTDQTTNLIARSLRVTRVLGAQVDQCIFSIKSPERYRGSAITTPQVGQEVTVEIKTSPSAAYERVFGGSIARVGETKIGYKTVKWDLACVDGTAKLLRALVNKKYLDQPLSDIVRDVVRMYAPFVTVSGVENTTVTVHPSVSFSQQYPADVIQQLAAAVGYEWFVDPNYNLHWYDPLGASYQSVNSLSDLSNNFDELVIEPQIDQVRNRIFVTGGVGLSDWIEETWDADGETQAFKLRHSSILAELTVSGEHPFMRINGAAVYCGEHGTDDESLFPFLLRKGPDGAEVYTSAETETIADLSRIVFTYRRPVPIAVVREDVASQEVVALIEGSDYDTVVNADLPLFRYKMDQASNRVPHGNSGTATSMSLPAGFRLLPSGYFEAKAFTSLAARTNPAVRFVGRGYLQAVSGAQVPRQAYTLEAWACPDVGSEIDGSALGGGIVGALKLSIGGGQTLGGAALVYTASGTYGLIHSAAGSQWLVPSRSEAKPTGGLTLDHVVGTWDATSKVAALYVNNVFVMSGYAPTAPVAILGSGLQVGDTDYQDLFSGMFRGVIDEVAVYDTVLSEQRRSAHYAAGKWSGVREFHISQPDASSFEQARAIADVSLRRWANVITKIQFTSRQHGWQVGHTIPVSFTLSGIGRTFVGDALTQQVELLAMGNQQVHYRVSCQASRFNMLDYERSLMRPPKVVRGEYTLLELIRKREDTLIVIDGTAAMTGYVPPFIVSTDPAATGIIKAGRWQVVT